MENKEPNNQKEFNPIPARILPTSLRLQLLTEVSYQASSTGLPAATIYRDEDAFYLGIIVSVQANPGVSYLAVDCQYSYDLKKNVYSLTATIHAIGHTSSTNDYQTFGNVIELPGIVKYTTILGTVLLESESGSYETHTNLTDATVPEDANPVPVTLLKSVKTPVISSVFQINTPLVAVYTKNNINQIDILIFLPDQQKGEQDPECFYCDTYSGENGITIPIFIQNIQPYAHGAVQRLYIFHLSSPYYFEAVHTVTNFPEPDGDYTGGNVGTRGTYVAVQKPPTLPPSV